MLWHYWCYSTWMGFLKYDVLQSRVAVYSEPKPCCLRLCDNYSSLCAYVCVCACVCRWSVNGTSAIYGAMVKVFWAFCQRSEVMIPLCTPQSLFLVQTRLLFKESYRGVLVITSKHVHPPSPAQLKPSAGRPGVGAADLPPRLSLPLTHICVQIKCLQACWFPWVMLSADSSNTGGITPVKLKCARNLLCIYQTFNCSPVLYTKERIFSSALTTC